MSVDRTRSLQDLEGTDWGEPPESATYLIATCHRLHRKRLQEFSVEDLRIMIGRAYPDVDRRRRVL